MSIDYGYVLPHPPLAVREIGRGKEEKIPSTIKSFIEVSRQIAEIKPDTIIVYTPHGTSYADYIHISPGKSAEGDFGNFGAFNVAFNQLYDHELVDAISKEAFKANIGGGSLGERDKKLDHGTLVPLYFINKLYNDYKLVRISLSGLSPIDHYNFGICVKKAVEKLNRKALVIASGDLSHKLKEDGPYGFDEAGPDFDKAIVDSLKKADFLSLLQMDKNFVDRAGQCGLQAFNILAGNFDKKELEVNFLSYEGPFGVGYASCTYKVIGDNKERNFGQKALDNIKKDALQKKEKESEYVKLARRAVELFIKKGKELKKSKESNLSKGVFVTLKIDGRLRGCIGTISPRKDNIYSEIIENAIGAAIDDPRFEPVGEDELHLITYSVDVLEKAEKIKSKEGLNHKKYGVIVTRGSRRGLLLPNLEGINSVEEQIDIALKKARIGPDEEYDIERFEVVRYE